MPWLERLLGTHAPGEQGDACVLLQPRPAPRACLPFLPYTWICRPRHRVHRFTVRCSCPVGRTTSCGCRTVAWGRGAGLRSSPAVGTLQAGWFIRDVKVRCSCGCGRQWAGSVTWMRWYAWIDVNSAARSCVVGRTVVVRIAALVASSHMGVEMNCIKHTNRPFLRCCTSDRNECSLCSMHGEGV